MIHIGKPHIEPHGQSHARLVASVAIDGNEADVWFEVENKYAQYLCSERADAYLVAVLNYAMRHHHDIVCDAPVGEYLYYQINTCLIDALAKGSPRMYRTVITAPVDSSSLPCASAVATGISCGIDSLHVLAECSDDSLPHHKLTHLTFNNVGSHGEGEQALKLFEERKKRARAFADEYGYEFVESNSNLMDVVLQNHYLTHTFSSGFAVLALQKLYAVYYYASSKTLLEFSVIDNDKKPNSCYEILTLSCFSTDKLRIYSEGANLSRMEKTARVIAYKPSYDYLNVCLVTSENCGRCEKCARTLLSLDALGALDLYRNVFDIDYYRSHPSYYFRILLWEYYKGHSEYLDLYPRFRKRIPFLLKLSVWLKFVLYSAVRSIPDCMLKRALRNVYVKLRRK